MKPRWPPVRVAVRSRRSNRKIGDCERSTTIQCLANYNPSSVKALRKLSCWLSLAALDRGTLDSKTTQNNNSDSGIQVTEFSTWTSGIVWVTSVSYVVMIGQCGFSVSTIIITQNPIGLFQKYHNTLTCPSKILHKNCSNAKFWRDNHKYYGIFEKKAHHNSKWSLKLPQKSHYQRMVARVLSPVFQQKK